MRSEKQVRDQVREVVSGMSKFMTEECFLAVMDAGIVDDEYLLQAGRQHVRKIIRDVSEKLRDVKGRRALQQLRIPDLDGNDQLYYCDVQQHFRTADDFRQPLKQYAKSIRSDKKAMMDLLGQATEVLNKQESGQLYLEFAYLDEIPELTEQEATS